MKQVISPRKLLGMQPRTGSQTFVQRRLPRSIGYRVAVRRGPQHPDAEGLTQHVFAIVGRKVAKCDLQQGRSFRGWLLKTTRDMVVNKLTRGPRDSEHSVSRNPFCIERSFLGENFGARQTTNSCFCSLQSPSQHAILPAHATRVAGECEFVLALGRW